MLKLPTEHACSLSLATLVSLAITLLIILSTGGTINQCSMRTGQTSFKLTTFINALWEIGQTLFQLTTFNSTYYTFKNSLLFGLLYGGGKSTFGPSIHTRIWLSSFPCRSHFSSSSRPPMWRSLKKISGTLERPVNKLRWAGMQCVIWTCMKMYMYVSGVHIQWMVMHGSVVRALAAKARDPGFDSRRLPRCFSSNKLSDVDGVMSSVIL